MESWVSSNCTRNIYRPSSLKKKSTEKKTPWEKLPTGDRSRQIRKFTHAQIQILAKFYSITYCFATKKIGIFRARFIAFPLVEFEVDEENKKLQVAKKISAFK